MSVNVSILVLTKNEESDLSECLDSVAWSDDIHVYDSFSTDHTVEIALRHGAHVTQRQFDNWASHQNWGLANIKFKHPWVFYIDADERMTPELKRVIEEVPLGIDGVVAYRIRRRDFLFARWLKHVQASPYYMRLFRPEAMRYERLVNPISIANGPIGDVNGYLDHYPFSKGMTHWVNRHNSYSSLEAQQITDNRKARAQYSFRKAFTCSDFHERRRNQKELFYRIPGRPFWKFLLLYFFRLGFLDGRAGFTYALLQSIYEYMIVLKVREINDYNARR
jgi:glycosyltransferase involved in cell wall biosynthesis